jgi:hypothetical protein
MADMSIDRLTLQIPGFSEADGKRLALAVAEALEAATLGRETGEANTLRVDLTAGAAAEPNVLAERIVAEVVRQIQRLP